MATILKKYYGFFLPFFLFLGFAGVFLLYNNRIESHIILNQFIYPPFNTFFTYYTYIGDGLMIVSVAALLLFVKFRFAFFLGLAGMLSGTVTNLIKNFVFDNLERPYFRFKYYYHEYDLNLILPEEAMHIHHSFPSGHTTGAFCLLVGLMFIFNKPKWSVLFFVLAFLGGYSRVYLSQHFLIDVYFGSIIGSISTIFVWLLFQKLNKNPKLNWWNKSLLTLKN